MLREQRDTLFAARTDVSGKVVAVCQAWLRMVLKLLG